MSSEKRRARRDSLRVLVLVVVAALEVGCGDDGAGLEAPDLQGTWVATVYEFTDNANPGTLVDIIQRDGASFVLTVDEAGTASTVFDDGVGGTISDSGTLNSEGTTLTLGGTAFEASRAGDVLTLMNAADQFDFGSGSVSATLSISMSRN